MLRLELQLPELLLSEPLSVDEFVQLLFPDGDPAASATLLERMTPEVRDVWRKLSLYEHVFLNEIV